MAVETVDKANYKFNLAKEFLKINYPNGFKGNLTYPLYLFYNEKEGFTAIQLTSGLANEHYWRFYGEFNSWEEMWCNLMTKY